MATNPPFELEDQTDEDFFDKLVNDDDYDVSGNGLKSAGLTEAHDVSDGNDSDEAKVFTNMSISEGDHAKVPLGTTHAAGSGNHVGEVHDAMDGDDSDVGKALANLSIKEDGNVNDASGATQVIGADHIIGEQRVEHQGQPVEEGETILSLVPSTSFSFDNEHVSENGIMTSNDRLDLRAESSGLDAGGVKEVQWSSFSDSGEHGGLGFGSHSDFFTDSGEGIMENFQSEAKKASGNEAVKNLITESLCNHAEYEGENGVVAGQSANGADINSTQYWENLYPGWKYDPNTGQWYQLDDSNGTNNAQENFAFTHEDAQGNFAVGVGSQWANSDVQAPQVSYSQQTTQSAARTVRQVSYSQQTTPSAVGTVSQFSTTGNVSGWNQVSQQNGEYQYPPHMIFDPQYPGWYYDTIAQEWRSLDAFHSSAEFMDLSHDQQAQNGDLSAADYSYDNSQSVNSSASPGLSTKDLSQSWAPSFGDSSEQGMSARQSGILSEGWSAVSSSGNQSWKRSHDSIVPSHSHVGQQSLSDSREMFTSYNTTYQSSDHSQGGDGSRSFVPMDNTFQQFSHTLQGDQNGAVQHLNPYYGGQPAASVSQPFFPNGHHAYPLSEGRSSAGRPPHALVTFGFGGKLLVMKDKGTGGFSTLVNKDPDGSLISVLNLMEVVSINNGLSGTGAGICSYVSSLCHQSFPGPLVGGNAGSKELHKWIDDRIESCDSGHTDYVKMKAVKLLLCLLKIACQHYGRLRSFGVDTGLMENDLPESAIAKLFASAKRNDGQFNEYSALTKCFMNLPLEPQIQTTATEVQNLLVYGRKKEALECAQEGQLWSFALILARELGEQFYADTVKQMAVSQLAVGSPLRTLCLLIAKKPEEVFSTDMVGAGNMPGAVHMFPQSVQNAGYSMLDNWEENLAMITANRTENDHLVMIHLGDCLWKEKNDVIAAHICYLAAEADFELYSDSARLCLIGADHWNFPRTYASPEAIQRTEFFEYSKVLGNSQFVLLPLQPYKLIYAHMLAEVGRVSDSLKYCQAVYKSLKTGRSPEAETLRQSLASLEERIRTHQQSGYAANLAPAKIVGKLLNFFDSTAHRVVGGLPPPVPATTQFGVQANEHPMQTLAPKVSSSQSSMAISSLMPSASMEPVSQWTVHGSRMTMQNRSVSEPDIGRSPKPDQVDSANEATSSSSEGKQSGTTGTSRFGRFNFGAQILQKTVGLVLKPRQGRQAKLGDTNKFYYDEKLKRWVEEGAEPPAEETALPPPPTTVFQNGMLDYNSNNTLNGGLSAVDNSPESASSIPFGSNSGIQAIPPSSNQFSARGRMGVRSRYVDTFNKDGSAPTSQFQTPLVPSAKPASVGGPKFFIPTAASLNDQTLGTEVGTQDDTKSEGNSSLSMNDPFQNLAPSPVGTMQRFPSVDNIPNRGTMGIGNSSLASQSRRTASWNDIRKDKYVPLMSVEMKASPLPFTPSDGFPASLQMHGGNFGDDLQEVEL